MEKLIALQPSLAEDLLSTVDTPLSIIKDPETGKSFLACDYNRDLDSYRSPWSNQYVPSLEDDDSPFPSKELRELEIKMNDSMDVYRDLYYEGGVSSVYLWDQEDGEGFAGVVLFKKSTENKKAQWDSIHVFEVETIGSQKAKYKVTSTIILDLSTKEKAREIGLAGNLIRQTEKEAEVEGDYGHLINLGTLIEDIESKLRNLLSQVYFDKTRDIIGDARSLSSLKDVASDKALHSEVVKGLQGL